jgi:hypothetical protein
MKEITTIISVAIMRNTILSLFIEKMNPLTYINPNSVSSQPDTTNIIGSDKLFFVPLYPCKDNELLSVLCKNYEDAHLLFIS